MKFLKIFIILMIVILTVIAGVSQQKLHKPLVITGADFQLQRFTEQISEKIVKTSSQNEQQVSRNVKIDPSSFVSDDMFLSMNDQKNAETVVKDASADEPDLNELEQLANDIRKESVQEPSKDDDNTKLTKKEELIAWNKWRSDVQNEIMMKTQVEAPIGTVFYFSFVVDKFRHISNIKGICSNPFAQKEVQTKLIPVIKSLEYTSLLEFPKGTNRDKTTVRGMFSLGFETMLSQPSDYNDIERVHVYE